MRRKGLPEWVEVWKVAKALGWTTQKTRELLARSKLAQRAPALGSGWFVQRDRLMSQLPEVARRLLELERSGLLAMPGRARCRTLSHQNAGARDARDARGPKNVIHQ